MKKYIIRDHKEKSSHRYEVQSVILKEVRASLRTHLRFRTINKNQIMRRTPLRPRTKPIPIFWFFHFNHSNIRFSRAATFFAGRCRLRRRLPARFRFSFGRRCLIINIGHGKNCNLGYVEIIIEKQSQSERFKHQDFHPGYWQCRKESAEDIEQKGK